VACLLGGCTVGLKYKPPDVPLTPAYKEADGWKAAHASDQALRGTWWEIFGDPKLNAQEEQVPGGNQKLKGLEARFREARAAIRFNDEKSGLGIVAACLKTGSRRVCREVTQPF
jgi:outer membrane protein TolC